MIGRGIGLPQHQCVIATHNKHAPHQCVKAQCQLCIDYQAGLTRPAFPVPAKLVDSVSDLAVRWSNWMDD